MEAKQEADNALKDLSGQVFDAVQYLNENLGPLQLASQSQAGGAKQNRTSQLQSASTDVQNKIIQLNAYSIRSSTELTTLTDEILRSGNRLAYEVEVLRGDVDSLHDILSETLKDDIEQFTSQHAARGSEEGVNGNTTQSNAGDPEFMQHLRILGHIKARLEEVIRVFGEALKWPIPPSDVSMNTSLIAVSAPELGVQSTEEDDRARAAIRQIRNEITDLLSSDGGGFAGYQAAYRKVDEYQSLALLWRGTSEERARNRVVDGFVRIVEDRRKALESQNQHRRPHQVESNRSSAFASRSGTPSQSGGGLFEGLRKLRDEMYLD